MSIITRLGAAARNRTTYRVGLLQARAFRVLKARTDEVLAPMGITSAHWALLGLLFEKDSMRMTEVALELGVEAPFVTTLISSLSKLKLVDTEPDPADSRAKRVFLTETGKAFVPKTEAHVRTAMRGLVAGTTVGDLASYLGVLEAIIANSEERA
ncbi:MAG: MarR family transcriptional regulator [Patescibacteria group bacterium]